MFSIFLLSLIPRHKENCSNYEEYSRVPSIRHVGVDCVPPIHTKHTEHDIGMHITESLIVLDPCQVLTLGYIPADM